MKTAAPLALAALCSLLWPCASRADELSDRVDKLFERYDRPDSPGCSIAIIRHGKVVYQRGYGLADIEKKVPNAPHTVFELASMSKQFTALSIALLAEERFFRPLGMTHTVIRDSKEVKIARRAKGYSRKRKGGIEEDTGLWNTIVGDGSVLTSVEDLYLWDQNFYHNKLGKGTPQLIETVETPGRLNNGKAIDYACGIEVGRYRGVRTVRHAGLWVGFGTDMVRCPDQEFTSICLANCSEVPSDDLNNRIMDIYLADEFKQRRGSK